MAFCSNCGEKIDDGVKFCSNCGKTINNLPNEPIIQLSKNKSAISQENNSSEVKKTLNIMALIGFIAGLISWLINLWGIVGITACIFSGIGLGKFNSKTENNKWMAIIGIISGGINIIYAAIQIINLQQ